MNKPLIKINDPGFTRDFIEETGPHRDDNGLPLHGIYFKQNKNIEEKMIINKGNLIKEYKYPIIKKDFKSPMLNDHNLHFYKSWSWTGVDQMEALRRVLDGNKPMGFWTVENEDDFNYCFRGRYDSRILDYPHIGTIQTVENSVMEMPFSELMSRYDKLPVKLKNRAVERLKPLFDTMQTECNIGVCVHGTFTENFNLNALFNDHCKYGNEMGADDDVLLGIWKLHEEIKDRQISDYLKHDFSKSESVEDRILEDLLLGIPIECTASILWN